MNPRFGQCRFQRPPGRYRSGSLPPLLLLQSRSRGAFSSDRINQPTSASEPMFGQSSRQGTPLLQFITVCALLLSLVLSPISWGASLSDQRWDPLLKRYAEIYVPEYEWRWVKAQAWQESMFDPAAVSPAGAVGLMQIMPGTGREMARRTGVRGPLTSPLVNVHYGTAYLRRMLDFWTTPRPPLARLDLAFASYNAGAGHILNAQRLAGGALLWEEIQLELPNVTGHHSKETRTYVRRIHRWKKELDDESDVAMGSADVHGACGAD